MTGLLGRGGMGAVYKARDPEIDRVVALKTVNPELLAGHELRDEFLERFRREARAAGRLSHPNIVSVYDLGTDERTSTPFIVMEYVDGISLEALLAENPALPVAQAVEILEQVSAALTEAHRAGVVHRDVKPANVFLDARGRVKVGDFGVARLEGSELTQTGVGLGTPGYSAPEVLRGAPADARSDVFALGVLAYRLLTGQRPFAGATREATAIEILEHAPAPPSALRPEIPEPVSAAVMHALAKDRDQRPPGAEDFATELRGAPGSSPVPPLALPAPTDARPAASLPTSTVAVATPTPPVPTVAVAEPTATIAVPTVADHRRKRRWSVTVLLGACALAALALFALRPAPAAGPRPSPEIPPRTRPQPPPPAERPSTLAPAPRPARVAPAPAFTPREDDERDDAKHGRDKDDKKGREREKGGKKGHGKGKGH